MVCDEGIAPAMSEEQNATDDPFAVDRKLTAKVNKAERRLKKSPALNLLSSTEIFEEQLANIKLDMLEALPQQIKTYDLYGIELTIDREIEQVTTDSGQNPV